MSIPLVPMTWKLLIGRLYAAGKTADEIRTALREVLGEDEAAKLEPLIADTRLS